MQEHWIWLSGRKGIGPVGCAYLIEKFGTAEQIYAMTSEELREQGITNPNLIRILADKSLDAAWGVMDACEHHGIKILTYCDEIYPKRLKSISDPPMVLYYKGEFPYVDEEAGIGIVGTRKGSLYGLLNAKEFGKSIACGGGMVVTGGARGIDTMALKGALEGQTPVICVLGSGLDMLYPHENRDLFLQVSKHGCLISEYVPGTRAYPGNFPVRNRIISGLSLGVLVVEAPERSGALITANHALEQGRDVFAVPGNIGTDACLGSNRLLREGAYMVESGWDILSMYQSLFPNKLYDPKKAENIKKLISYRYSNTLPVYTPVYENPFNQKKIDIPEKKTYSDEKPTLNNLTPDEQLVLDHLTAERIHMDNLTVASGLPVSRVAAAITLLQIKKAVSRLPGNYVIRN